MWRLSQQVKRLHLSSNYTHAAHEYTFDHLKVFAEFRQVQVASGPESVRTFLVVLYLAQLID